jgi:hypothetical protein
MFVLAAMAASAQIGLSDSGYHPFSEPMEFDPDWQFFAPVQMQDLEELTARQRANTGFFLTYDRLYIGLDRSDTEQASNQIDFTWGNRFDFGWMKSNESGWTFSCMNVSGPNVYNIVEVQRLNQFITTANGGNGVIGINGPIGTNGSPGLVGNFPFVPVGFRNNVDGERLYYVRDSVNVGSFASFEANKTWRMEPYRYGGILEPMVGLRYSFYGEGTYNDSYPPPQPTVAPQIPVPGLSETFTTDETETNNYMLLGQMGFRYTKFINRWTLSNDFRFFGGVNYQNLSHSQRSVTSTYAPTPAVGAVAVTDNINTGTFSGFKAEKGTLGFDLRVEGAYKATKYLDLRGGFGLIYFNQGIARGPLQTVANQQPGGPSTELSDQNLIMPSFTFGVALNR